MTRLWQFLTNRKSLAVMGALAFAAVLFIIAVIFALPYFWVLPALAAAALVWLAVWFVRRRRQAAQAAAFGAMLDQQGTPPPVNGNPALREENAAIRLRMQEAIATIKSSRLGELAGDAALYELPWYMVIGNPAAGKSSAISNSGLQFPLANNKIVHGVGGTRNCDWFFTNEGILLDTAGRYAVDDDDRAEWFGFLSLLRKHRARAPINGIIIAVSIAELTGGRPEDGLKLARSLRLRVQELTERLAVQAPVYVVFTKADLINGFHAFFGEADRVERDKVWGATLPYNPANSSSEQLAFFDQRFDELYDGLKALSVANMSANSKERVTPGVFTFPLEFSSIKAPLRSFIATLFEENPYQFKPVFRGFYFTSALQEGGSECSSSARVAQRFDLGLLAQAPADVASQHGYFLLNLFHKVIFADKDLVSQYASANKVRLRYAGFFAAVALVGLSLGGWTWSYSNNRQLLANVEADLVQAVKLQEQRIDLQSRFEALEIMQDRIEQLQGFRRKRPLALSLGLYQGDALERKLRKEYYAGLRQIMLKPVAQSLEAYLGELNSSAAASAAAAGTGAATQFKDASPANREEGYNALKAYLMLGEPARAEASHLNDQLTRFWRAWLDGNRGAMPREQMIRSAERMIAFYLGQIGDPAWPALETKLTLVDQSREFLRKDVSGMPARSRVYADIKARAATRFPSVTVARIVGDQDKELVLGSHAISGAFSRAAWDGYLREAFREAANRTMRSADWVLKSASTEDLTIAGSPEQNEKALVELYKNDYAQQWQTFLQGVTIKELDGFDSAAAAMNRLGDPQASPIAKLIETVHQETSWDNPTLVDAGVKNAERGFKAWFNEAVMRRTPTPLKTGMPAGPATGGAPLTPASMPQGPVGRAFSGVAQLVVSRDRDASLMRGYMEALSKLRTRFNTIKNQGDTGPGAKQFMQQTLDGNGSELADALKYVDEQMLVGMSDQQKQSLRPLLVRPLMQTFAVIVKPAELEINKVWTAQVLAPFEKNLAVKFPFTANARVEASDAEVGAVFGPDGAIAKFFDATMGPLVVRRGDTMSARTWANMGITLAPAVTGGFPGWVAPLAAGGVVAGADAGVAQTRFDLQALQAAGATEYTIEIDGQQLRWRGQAQPWVHLVWPNPQGVPGSRISAITPEGRTVVLLNEPGHFGLRKMIDAAKRRRLEGGVFELSWSDGMVTVMANVKILGSAAPAPAAAPSQGFRNLRLPQAITAAVPAPVPAPLSAPVPAAPATLAAAGAQP
ncbi:MAG: type VI secretion system membrane subunit TssM [Pseudomonadota bacterium]